MPDTTPSLANFDITRWTLIGRAADRDPQVRKAALNELFTRYVPALRAYLVGRRRMQRAQADDVLQAFLTEKILDQGILERADRQRGRLRNFLLVSLDRYLISRARYDQASRRSPQSAAASLDAQPELVEPAQAADGMFEVEWARQLLSDAVRRMREQCLACGQETQWRVFEERVLKPTLDNAAPMEYEQLVRQFGFASPREVQNVLVNAKRRFTNCLRQAVADYEGSQADIDSEILDLREILSRGGG